MDAWSKATLKSLLPGGAVLLAVALLIETDWFTLALPTLMLLYYGFVAIGLLLAWRFHASRVFFALLVLLLAQQAVALFSPRGAGAYSGFDQAALSAIAILLPLNFVLLALQREPGFTQPGVTGQSLFLFAQTVVVAVIGHVSSGHGTVHSARHAATVLPFPGYVWFAFGAAAVILLARFLLLRTPVESALFWALGAFFLALHFGNAARAASAYFAAAALILAVSVTETSYALAFHDELTTLPSRRAFNDSLLRLQAPYSIAIVDIDHFKKFNDTYGHDTGDEVLRLVASRLARVTGGGEAFRCGGEEFAILFPGKTTAEVRDPLEELRRTIENSPFRMRGNDRRRTPRGPDRRNPGTRKRSSHGQAIRQLAQPAADNHDAPAVTVSIGVATSTRENINAEQVIRAADQALYRAKAAGRNRVETAVPPRRERTKAAGIA